MIYGSNRYKKLFVLTLVIVLILIGIIAYIILIKPTFNGYIVKKQIETRDMVLFSILSQIQQQGYTQIIFGNETLILIPVTPNQIQELNK